MPKCERHASIHFNTMEGAPKSTPKTVGMRVGKETHLTLRLMYRPQNVVNPGVEQ